MPALGAGIHVLATLQKVKDVDGWDIGVRSTPFFERLCPAMTIEDKRLPHPTSVECIRRSTEDVLPRFEVSLLSALR